MPTLVEYRDDYYALSGKASDVVRSLGFAGIAVIWIFKSAQPEGKYILPLDLYWAGLLIVASLALDLLQYALGALIWGAFWRLNEKSGVLDDEKLDAPSYFNWPALICFWGKLLTMIIAYALVLVYLLHNLLVR